MKSKIKLKGYCIAEYYSELEPLFAIDYLAFTKKGSIQKAKKNIKKVENIGVGKVYYMQVWFNGKKVFGDGNIDYTKTQSTKRL